MSLAALILGIVSIMLALASLTWQIVTHWLSGPRIKASLRVGLAHPSGGAVTWPPDGNLADGQIEDLTSQGYQTRVMTVTASNTGRMATTVQGVRFSVSGGADVRPLADLIGPTLPARLEAYDELTWTVAADPILAAAKAARGALSGNGSFNAKVEYTGGESVTSTMPGPPPSPS